MSPIGQQSGGAQFPIFVPHRNTQRRCYLLRGRTQRRGYFPVEVLTGGALSYSGKRSVGIISHGATEWRSLISSATVCPAGVHSGGALCIADAKSVRAISLLGYTAAGIYAPAVEHSSGAVSHVGQPAGLHGVGDLFPRRAHTAPRVRGGAGENVVERPPSGHMV